MSRLSPSRRVVALGTASLLSLGGLVVLGSASAATACPTYTDAAGDSAPNGNAALAPLLGDPSLDILAVSHSVDAGVFSTTVKVTKLQEYLLSSTRRETCSACSSRLRARPWS